MTSYTAIPNTDLDQNSPVTEPLMLLIRDNPIAMLEGAAGAPRMAKAVQLGHSSATTPIVFTGLEEFQGGMFLIQITNIGGTGRSFYFSISDDGSTWENDLIAPVLANESILIIGQLDHTTLTTRYTYGPYSSSHTYTTTSTAITDVRVYGETDLIFSAVYLPNGGNSAV